MIDEAKLRPWQVAPAKRLLEILQTHDSALDASETGVGKTYTAMAIAQALQLPCLAIVPKIAISGWRAVAEHFNESISVIGYELLRTGKTPYGAWQNQRQMSAGRSAVFVCCFCQRRATEQELVADCFTNPAQIHCVNRQARPVHTGRFIFNKAVKLVLWDEVQRCSGMNSLNAKMLIGCKQQKIKHLMLSATPFDTVLKAKAIGFSLDLFTI